MKSNRKKFAKNCSNFLTNPFEFAREVIAPKPTGKMESSKEEVEGYLQRAHSKTEDEGDKPVQTPENLHEYADPVVDFKNKEPTWREFGGRLRKTRSKSAPGPNGVPYLVYKTCEGIAKLL